MDPLGFDSVEGNFRGSLFLSKSACEKTFTDFCLFFACSESGQGQAAGGAGGRISGRRTICFPFQQEAKEGY